MQLWRLACGTSTIVDIRRLKVKHGIYSPFFSLQNAVCFIILTYLVPVFIHILYTGCAKIKKKIIPAPKG